MPAVSKRQQQFMGICAHQPSKARKECPSKEVAMEFARKPKGGYPQHKGASPHMGTLYAHKARHGIS